MLAMDFFAFRPGEGPAVFLYLPDLKTKEYPAAGKIFLKKKTEKFGLFTVLSKFVLLI